MSAFVIFTIFVMAFLVTVLRGARWSFVMVYLPALILFSELPEVKGIPHIPMLSEFVGLYGILLGMPFRSESLRFRICSIDVVVVLMLISIGITTANTELTETTINLTRNEFLAWVLPYLLARMVFSNLEARKVALWTLVPLIAFTSFATLIELRMRPYFYLHLLNNLGMYVTIQPMAYRRFGFFRVACTVMHPIYWGNINLVLLGVVVVLIKTTGNSFRNKWLALTTFATVGCLVASLSFTPYMGLLAGLLVFSSLYFVPLIRKLLLPLSISAVVLLAAVTYWVAISPLPVADKSEGMSGSLSTRSLIIQRSWVVASRAGYFGFGRYLPDDLGLSSVDNSYMHWAMTRGWVYVMLFVAIGLLFAWRVQKALARCTHDSQRFPLCAAAGTVLGVMVAMYTVWPGSIYLVLWAIMLGLSNTLIDMVLAAPSSATLPSIGSGSSVRVSPRRRAALFNQPSEPPGVSVRAPFEAAGG